ncbi:MAG TPA: transposase, partial [Vicinamibacterales bacterium]|nr:transposase [Vicinamibacterales bacterium]
DGFDLHANVWVGTHDRAGLERLCRYILRPPFAQERMRLRGDGRVALELKRAWHDGTRELVFEPLEFLAEHVAHWAGSLDRRGGRSRGHCPCHELTAASRKAARR